MSSYLRKLLWGQEIDDSGESEKGNELRRKEELAREKVRQEGFKRGLIVMGSKLSTGALFLTVVLFSMTAWIRGLTGTDQLTRPQDASFVPPQNIPKKFQAIVSVGTSPPFLIPSNHNEQSGIKMTTEKLPAIRKDEALYIGKKSPQTSVVDPEMQAFSFTYVVYKKGDNIGMLLALFTLSPVFIVVMYATLIVFRRDLETILSFIGQLLGVAVAIVAKKLIAQPRPDGAMLPDEGMPSNHVRKHLLTCMCYLCSKVN